MTPSLDSTRDPDDAELVAVAERYARFARDEAAGRSEVYREWSVGISEDASACGILARIPAQHRQPPLVFAVARSLGAPVGGWSGFSRWLQANGDALVAAASTRLLQTNEPGRCAPLLLGLALVARETSAPIALLEVGASAGICLYPDRYSYRFVHSGRVATVVAAEADAPVLTCELRGTMVPPLPAPTSPGSPRPATGGIVWRAGLDLQPLDAADERDRAFLTGLAWPGEEGREQRIAAALDVVAADPPVLWRGDVGDTDAEGRGVLEDLAARAPAGATLVVSTPGVTPHLPWPVRQALPARIAALGGRWLTIDPPPRAPDAPPGTPPGAFTLALDGRPLARCDALGRWLEWLPGEP